MKKHYLDIAEASERILFGEVEYFFHSQRLVSANGQETLLRSQSAKVLHLLACKLGNLVTRDELVQDVWADIAVTDDSLTQCIADIRRAIQDSDRKLLKTVPKRGYILNGTVEPKVLPPAEPLVAARGNHTGFAGRGCAVAVTGQSVLLQDIMDALPAALRPIRTSIEGEATLVLIYDEPGAALRAAVHIGNENRCAISVESLATRTEHPLCRMCGVDQGEVRTTREMAAFATASLGIEFFATGSKEPDPAGKVEPQGQLLPLVPADTIVPQLDPNDVLPTLAILPLKAQAGSQDESLGALFANDITTALSRAEDVNIISWLSTSSMASPTGGLRDVGHQLRADFILSGYVVSRGGKVIVSVEFCETETQFVLWSDRFERQLDSFLEDTDSVHQIVTRIRKAITLNELRRLQARPLGSLKLFSILQGAVGLMYRLIPKEFNQAKTYLEYVSAQAPNHPAPLAWMARWHVLRTVQGWAEDPAMEARAALHFTGRALELEPDHGLALVCEGQVLVNLALRLDEAEDRYSAALASNPNDAQARALRGMLAAFRDQGAEAKRDTERALHLAPLDPHRFIFLVQAAGANISAEDYPRAVTLAKESLRLNRSHSSTMRTLAVAQAGMGDIDDARQTAKELLRLQPGMRVSTWLRASPSADYEMGRKAAELMRLAGIPD
nr:winged helix-turn-helix domain-containing protein [Labrenzia sp. OB1]